jgi:PPOX class probable F420-dependent enzyme
MPRPPLTDAAQALLNRPNAAVIAVVRPDGQPVSVVTWYLLDDDGRILVNMDAERKRLAYMRQNPRVSLTVLEEGDWGTHVSVQGPIAHWRDDHDWADIDRLCQRYVGAPYPDHVRPRVSAFIDIDYWHGWGALKSTAG